MTKRPGNATAKAGAGAAVGGVLLGYLTFAVASVALFRVADQDPNAPASTGFMAVSSLLGMAFAAAGGYLAELVARRGTLGAGLGVALLIGTGAMVSLGSVPAGQTGWSQVAALMLISPCAVLGAAWRVRTRGER